MPLTSIYYYGLGFFGMNILPLSFLDRLRGFDLCWFVDEDESSTYGLFGSGCRIEPLLCTDVGRTEVAERFCDRGFARTDSVKL